MFLLKKKIISFIIILTLINFSFFPSIFVCVGVQTKQLFAKLAAIPSTATAKNNP
jgi:hypothetical protein